MVVKKSGNVAVKNWQYGVNNTRQYGEKKSHNMGVKKSVNIVVKNLAIWQ